MSAPAFAIPPIAVNDAVVVDEGGSVAGNPNVLTNDFDIENDPLTAVIVTPPPNAASFELNSDGTFSYTHDGSETTSDSFTYRAFDGALSNVAIVSISVTPVNDLPTAVNDGPFGVDEGGSIAGNPNVLSNDTDPENDVLTAVLVAEPANAASFTLNLDGTFSYTHDGGETTADSFTYTANDGDGPSNVATVSITVNAINDPPVAVDDGPFSVDEGGAVGGNPNVLSNDTDPENDTLTAIPVAGPANAASFTLNSDGTFVYVHDGSETTSDSFTYQASDGSPSNVATVSITVNSLNDPPVAADDGPFNADEGGVIAGNPNVLSNDSDPENDPLTALLVSPPSNASSFDLNSDGTFSYTHDGGETTADSFTYQASDGSLSNVATVSITINPVNDPPTAFDDTDSTPEDTPVTTDVRANDVDPDIGEILRVTVQTDVATSNGTVSCSAASCTYTPELNFNGTDSYNYEVCDDGVPQLCSTATVTIDVDPVNDEPEITSQADPNLSTDEDTALEITLADLLADDVDNTFPDDFTLNVRNGANYSRSGNTITPSQDYNGPLTVPVTINDGTDDSAVFNMSVTVVPVNDQPQIAGQQALSTAEDSSLTVIVDNLLVVDPDNAFPADFILELMDGTDYTRAGNVITPANNFNGQLTVPATVSDGELSSGVFNLIVEVTPVNDVPILETAIGPQNAIEASPFDLDISGNFIDVDNEPLSFAASGLPASGNIQFDEQTGVFSGTPQIEDAEPVSVYDVVVTASDAADTFVVDTFQLTVSALDRANVSLTIDVAPEPAMINDELRWTFTARNPLGPQDATNVQLSGSFVGAGLSVMPADPVACTIEAEVGQVTDFSCSMGSLPVGGVSTVIISTTASAVGHVNAFATAEGLDRIPIDPNLDDNSLQLAAGVAEIFSNGAVQVLGTADVRSVTAGDIDGDGAADLIVGTAAGQPIQIYLSGGFRDFLTSPIALADNAANEGLALADFDGDDVLDLAVANGGGQADMVYRNDGVGNFSPMSTLQATFSLGVAVGDFDDDGNADLVFATVQGNPVYLGDGAGGFSMDAILGNANSFAVAVGEFDDDTLDDVVFANVGSDSQIWTRNSGSGFSAGSVLPIGDAVSVAVGQFGGDDRPDLAFGRVPTDLGDMPANPVLLNDGSGGFGNPVALLGAAPTGEIHAGDVNRDGMTDLIFINLSGVHQIWFANGTGFDLHTEQIADTDSIAGVLTELGMADVGDDGGVDLAMGGALQAGVGVFLNDGFGNLGRGDAVAPVLTLLGEATVSVPSGSAYVDDGATADDNIDGDISAAIVVSNTVNTTVVGNYTVTYNVTDSAGNPADSITRSVDVTPAAGTGGGGGGALTIATLLALMIYFVIGYAYRTGAVLPMHASKSEQKDTT